MDGPPLGARGGELGWPGWFSRLILLGHWHNTESNRRKGKGKDSLGISGRFDMVGTSDATEGGIPRGDGRGGDGRGVRKHSFKRVSDLKFLVIELERKQPLGSHCFWFFLCFR